MFAHYPSLTKRNKYLDIVNINQQVGIVNLKITQWTTYAAVYLAGGKLIDVIKRKLKVLFHFVWVFATS